jgi:ERCC4-related helicase
MLPVSSTRRRCISAIANMMFSIMRPYQERVVDSIGSSNNAIVKMPAGSGKTIVAAELIKRRLEVDSSLAALFLVPAQDLVVQQAVVVRTWCPAETTEVFEFMGGMADPRIHEATGKKVCIVSTPKAFILLQRREPRWFGWDQFGIVVFDEVHHVLKDHPYRNLALDMRGWHVKEETTKRKLQVIGMSASLTYDVEESDPGPSLPRIDD